MSAQRAGGGETLISHKPLDGVLYYVHDPMCSWCEYPSDDDTLVALAGEPGLDRSKFRRDLNAPASRRQLEREMALGQELNATSFPSLVLVEEEAHWPIPLDYRSAKAVLKTILTLHIAAHAS